MESSQISFVGEGGQGFARKDPMPLSKELLYVCGEDNKESKNELVKLWVNCGSKAVLGGVWGKKISLYCLLMVSVVTIHTQYKPFLKAVQTHISW